MQDLIDYLTYLIEENDHRFEFVCSASNGEIQIYDKHYKHLYTIHINKEKERT